MSQVYISPDEKIEKVTIHQGTVGLKPTENSECKVEITNCDIKVKNVYVVGNADGEFERLLDKCLMTMNHGETSNVTFHMQEKIAQFTICLLSFTSNGLIYEWDAQLKFELAVQHKDKGVALFPSNFVDASHRFSKALKLLASIPRDIEEQSTEVDNVRNLKAILYNNLASCYLKHHDYDNVIALCMRVLEIEAENVKALYKLGIACAEVRDFDRSFEILKKAASIEPKNKAIADKLREISVKLNEVNGRVNAMVKKMFEQ